MFTIVKLHNAMMRYFSFVFSLLLIFIPGRGKAQFLNQEAFAPQAVKHLFLPEEMGETGFSVVNQAGETVLSGITGKSKIWPPAGMKVSIADLSSVNETGDYLVYVNEKKYPFSVADSVNKTLGKALLKSFYFARVSEPVLEKHAGVYARPLGHPDDHIYVHRSAASKGRPAGSVISSPGGWYDAGDYNKYIVNSGITTFTLLHLYELFPTAFSELELNIPETGNQVPDILDEALVNLQWMMTMQDPRDGGVYHKLTSLGFCGMIPPHQDKLDRFVVYKTTSASLNLAATLAKASRIFSDFEKEYPGLSQDFLEAAHKAYTWAVKNPSIRYKNPPDVKTGQYDDSELKDEWFWASVELFLTTGADKYLEKTQLSNQVFTVPEWRRTNMLGIYSVLSGNSPYRDELPVKRMRKKLIAIATNKYQEQRSNAFRSTLVRFPWGSNSEVANDGLLSLIAFKQTGDKRFLETAETCVNYILGANPLDKCFVTGFGKKSPMHLHDRRCASDGIAEPIPGLLAGGPSRDARVDCGDENYPSDFPALSYLDEQCSYSTNETAINWNSAGAALFLGLHFIHEKNDQDLAN
jgi:endoglucanase